MDVDNEVWGIWSGEPMFTVCLCCPCCCIPRRGYQYLHPEQKKWQFNPTKKLQWKFNPTKCRHELCGSCVRQCPAKALSFKEGRLVFDDDACLRCGRCMQVCMEECISIETPDLEALVNELFGRYDGAHGGQCGDLGFDGEDYTEAIVKTAQELGRF